MSGGTFRTHDLVTPRTAAIAKVEFTRSQADTAHMNVVLLEGQLRAAKKAADRCEAALVAAQTALAEMERESARLLVQARTAAIELLSWRGLRWPRPSANSGFDDALDDAKRKFQASLRELRELRRAQAGQVIR